MNHNKYYICDKILQNNNILNKNNLGQITGYQNQKIENYLGTNLFHL